MDDKTGKRTYDMALQFPKSEYATPATERFLDGIKAMEAKIKAAASDSESKSGMEAMLEKLMKLKGERAALADVVNFTSAATGYSLFDKGSITEQTGAVPKYGVLMLDVEASNNDFQGVVALDRAGYVVWYANSHNEVATADGKSLCSLCCAEPQSCYGNT